MALNVIVSGEGIPVVLLHGLTATHRYVVMGSRELERSGHRVIAYDARGHGTSDPADRYDYETLAADLVAVMDAHDVDAAVLAGASMGAHAALALALAAPERVAGVVAVTPGFDPETFDEPRKLARWDALARGLREGGVEGFVEAYGTPGADQRWDATLRTVLFQRLSLHAHQDAVADAIEQVPRSRPFAALSELRQVSCPSIVIGTRDEPDPGHPLELARRYADALSAELLVEDQGRPPVAWQGGRVSRTIAQIASEAVSQGRFRP